MTPEQLPPAAVAINCVDGRVQGTIRAGKSVVVGEGGEVEGGIYTQDAVIAGHISGTVHAESRVELKEGCLVEGDIHSPSVRLEEGGRIDGEMDMSGDGGGPGGASREEAAARESGRASSDASAGETDAGDSKAEE